MKTYEVYRERLGYFWTCRVRIAELRGTVYKRRLDGLWVVVDRHTVVAHSAVIDTLPGHRRLKEAVVTAILMYGG